MPQDFASLTRLLLIEDGDEAVGSTRDHGETIVGSELAPSVGSDIELATWGDEFLLLDEIAQQAVDRASDSELD